jgi:hypothetical protein
LDTEFACHYSPVLSAAFNSNFMEGETQTYRLEDINPSTFRLLVQWLYHGKFDVFKQDDLECPDDEDDPEIEKLWAAQDLDLVQLWIVADKLLIRPLQNAVIAVLEDFWEEPFVRHRGPTTSWIPYVYEHTSVGSPLRDFAADVCAYKVSPERFSEAPDDFPKEVLLDMAIVLSKAVQMFAPDDDDDAAGDWDTDSDSDEDEDEDEDEGEDDEEGEEDNANNDDSVEPGDDSLNRDEAVQGELDDENEYFIGDMPLPRYQLTRTWRTYSVPEDDKNLIKVE